LRHVFGLSEPNREAVDMGATRDIVDRAVRDASFRAALKADPKKAIAQALGVTLPEDLVISIHEDGPTTVHIVLPAAAESGEPPLTDDDITRVAGGFTAEARKPQQPVSWSMECTW
jgi:hypothetical protein